MNIYPKRLFKFFVFIFRKNIFNDSILLMKLTVEKHSKKFKKFKIVSIHCRISNLSITLQQHSETSFSYWSNISLYIFVLLGYGLVAVPQEKKLTRLRFGLKRPQMKKRIRQNNLTRYRNITYPSSSYSCSSHSLIQTLITITYMHVLTGTMFMLNI